MCCKKYINSAADSLYTLHKFKIDRQVGFEKKVLEILVYIAIKVIFAVHFKLNEFTLLVNWPFGSMLLKVTNYAPIEQLDLQCGGY